VATKHVKKGTQARWVQLEEALSQTVPQVFSILANEDDFISLYAKIRDDRTTLLVLKRYGSDGGPTVCFGSGYGVAGAFLALEAK
jgi:nucleoid-associated protein YejK